MNARHVLILIVILGCMVISQTGLAFEKVGTAGFTFLEIPVGARQTAMGEAVIGLDDLGAFGVFWNPSTLGFIEGPMAGVGYSSWIADISQTSVAFGMPVGNVGTVGLSIVYVGFPDMQGSIVDLASTTGYSLTKKFSSSGLAAGVSFAHRFTDSFSFGGTVRYVRQEIADYTSDGFIGDVGTLYFTGLSSLRFATSFQSLGLEQEYVYDAFRMPIVYRVGAAMDFFDWPDSPAKLTVSAEAVSHTDYAERLHVGGEIWMMDMVALRGGYKFNYDEEDYTAGLGVKFSSGTFILQLDAGYGNFGLFDKVTHFSLQVGM